VLRWCWPRVYCDNCKVLSGLLVACWFGLFFLSGGVEGKEYVVVGSLAPAAAALGANDDCGESF